MEFNLESLTRAQLVQIKAQVEQRLDFEEKTTRLEEEVQEQGYAFRKERIDCKYPTIGLRVGLRVMTWDRKNWHLSGRAAKEQDPWFEHLPYPDIDDFTIEDVKYIEEDWEADDWDDPIPTTGWAIVWLYFERGQLPPEGKTIRILWDDEEGRVYSLSVKGGVVYIDGQPLDDWKEDFISLPEREPTQS